MAPPAKRRKTQAQKYLCFTCDTERVSKQFPRYNPTDECTHLIHTCTNCLRQWVKTQVESGTFVRDTGDDGLGFGVACPQCDCVMRRDNVLIAATKTVFDRFDELERKHIADNTPGWRWCLRPSCRAGQVHEKKAPTPITTKPKAKTRKPPTSEANNEPDLCICHECGASACVPCDRPWHEGETCAEHQARIKDRVEEEDEALRQIDKTTKPCPHCHKRIEKNGGCPMMYCTQCHSQFCWTCEEVLTDDLCACARERQRQQALANNRR